MENDNFSNQNNLKTIKELFNDTFYRVPDYQRGYSWNKEFIDLWNDIIRLYHLNNKSRKHYIGMLALDKIKQKHDLDRECLNNTDSFYIVDGQQRITSIIIILKVILEYAQEENIDNFDYEIIKNVLESQYKIHRFGYSEKRKDGAEEYFNQRIYEYREDCVSSSQYFSNINYVAEFLKKDLDKFNDEDIVKIVNIILNCLIFNVYYITEDFDVRVTFETMNNRGKPLTNLELLKNRLMYLSTFFDKNIYQNKINILQKKIDEAWKNIYDNLNYENSNLSDDLYLKAHWIVYKRLNKKNGNAFIDDILNNEFSVDSGEFYELCCKNFKYDEAFDILFDYIESLSLYSKYWAIVNVPNNINLNITDDEKKWLKRLSCLPDLFYAKVSVMVVLAEKNISQIDKIQFYKNLESFIFIFKLLAQDKKIDMSFLIGASRDLLHCSAECKTSRFQILINSIINHDILPLKKDSILDAIKKFQEYISDRNYYNWNGIRYFLYEYNDYLSIQNAAPIEWYRNKDVSVEHVLPQDFKRNYWKCVLKKYNMLGEENEENRLKVINSLGNLLLLSTSSENSSLKNYSFPVKKDISVESGKFAYCYGSRSAIEISKEPVWTVKEIYERTFKLFNFMYEHWMKNYITKEEWNSTIKEINLCNFKYNKLDDNLYTLLVSELNSIDTSQERKEAENKLKQNNEDDFLEKQLESFFDKDIFHLKHNTRLSFIQERFTYVLSKNYNDNNLSMFKCGIKLGNQEYMIQYNFQSNKIRINLGKGWGEYNFDNIDALPDLLRRFMKHFFKYIRKTTNKSIPELY